MSKIVTCCDDNVVGLQAKALVEGVALRTKEDVKLVLMPNATPALPLNPLSGFVMEASSKLLLDESFLDKASLFKGRAITKALDMTMLPPGQDVHIIDKLMKEKVTPTWFYETFLWALHVTRDKVNKLASEVSVGMIKIDISKNVQSSASIVKSTVDDDLFVVVDASADPADEVDIADLDELLSGKFTADEVTRSLFYQRYYRSVKMFRTVLALTIKKKVLSLLFGEADDGDDDDAQSAGEIAVAGGLGVQHYETNLVKKLGSTKVVVFSNAFDGEDGGLIYAGPYRNMLWVNPHNDRAVTLKMQRGNMLYALPYDTPTSVRRFDALEHVIMKYTVNGDESEDEDTASSSPVATRTVVKRDKAKLDIISVASASIPMKPTSSDKKTVRTVAQYKAQGLMSTLVWRESPSQLPVAVADEYINYHLPVENVPDLEKMGIDLADDTNHIPLRVIIQALAPVAFLDQLMIWRAAHSAKQRSSKQ